MTPNSDATPPAGEFTAIKQSSADPLAPRIMVGSGTCTALLRGFVHDRQESLRSARKSAFRKM